MAQGVGYLLLKNNGLSSGAQNSQKSQGPMHRQRQVALWSPLTIHSSQNGNPSSRETLDPYKQRNKGTKTSGGQ